MRKTVAKKPPLYYKKSIRDVKRLNFSLSAILNAIRSFLCAWACIRALKSSVGFD